MKEIFDLMRERCVSGDARIGRSSLSAFLEIINEAEAKWKEDCCEWKWGIGSAHVQCQGDRIIFDSRRLFTYCPYCGKKISEVE